MAVSVVMPALEIAQETGKLVAWLKKEGDSIRCGEPLLEVETEKAVLEVEAHADGILAGVCADQGSVIPVGQVIAWIVSPGEAVPVNTASIETAVESTRQKAPTLGRAPGKPATPNQRISPKARRVATEYSIDLTEVLGSGPNAEILASDVQLRIDAKSSAARAVTVSATVPEGISSIGRLMADRTTRSWTTVPHFFLTCEVDAGALNDTRAALRAAIESTGSLKLTHTDLLIALVARTLLKHPLLNASWIESNIHINTEVRVAIAIAVSDGVVTAVIPNAAVRGLGEIAAHRRELTERATAGRLRSSDVVGATFTISNLGMFQIDSFSAIITPPQAAVLAVGRIANRAVPIGGGIGVRPMFTLTLSADHRVVDGAKAAMFMHDLAAAIQSPESCLC